MTEQELKEDYIHKLIFPLREQLENKIKELNNYIAKIRSVHIGISKDKQGKGIGKYKSSILKIIRKLCPDIHERKSISKMGWKGGYCVKYPYETKLANDKKYFKLDDLIQAIQEEKLECGIEIRYTIMKTGLYDDIDRMPPYDKKLNQVESCSKTIYQSEKYIYWK